MKTNKNLILYCRNNYSSSSYKMTAAKASENDAKEPLVKSKYPVFKFDAISKTECGQQELKSCDAVTIKGKNLVFIEFKRGINDIRFEQKSCPIGAKYFGCDNQNCKTCLNAFKNYNEEKYENFKLSISLKITQTLYTIKNIIFPKCTEGKELNIVFILVVDSEKIAEDNIESILSEISGYKNISKVNAVEKMKNAIKKYGQEFDGKRIFFEKVDVLTNEDFDLKYQYK